MTLCRLIAILISIALALVMTELGYDITTWPWWCVVLGVNVTYIAGAESERKIKND